MSYVALKLNEKNLQEKKKLTSDLAAAFTLNVATFTSPNPAPTALTAKVEEITAKEAEVSAAETAYENQLIELAQLENELDAMLITSGAYVQEKSGGSAAKIALLGLPVKASPSAPPAPGPVMNFKLTPGDKAGEVKSSLKPASGAQSYEYEQTLDPTKPESWTHLDTSSGCRAKFTGLVSGSKIWVRARAIGGKDTGKGPWSDPATITVP